MTDERKFTMPLGKFKGYTLDEIMNESGGENYLDWLIGWMEETKQTEKDVYKQVVEYMEK